MMILAIVAMFSCNSFGQKSKKVPDAVKSAFTQKFPNATKVKWDKENEKEWEAEFHMNGKEVSVNFDSNGVWLETEYEIAIKDIPVAVKATLDKEFLGYKIKESEISETASGKLYEFDLQKDKVKMEVGIDINGIVIKKEEKKKGEDND